MRRIREAVLAFRFNSDEHLPKTVREYRTKYKGVSRILDEHPELLEGLYEFLCQASRVRYLLVGSGMRPSYRMAKWFSACFQWRIGMVHRFDAS